MIRTPLLRGRFEERQIADFDFVREELSSELEALARVPLVGIIAVLSELGRQLAKDRTLASEPGVSYLSLWLRRRQLDRVCRLNFLTEDGFQTFSDSSSGFQMRQQPRGIVCHWIAGNTPTLAVFSLVLAMLTRNASLLKVSGKSLPLVLEVLQRLEGVEAHVDSVLYRGRDLVRGVAVVVFPGDDIALSGGMSRVADAKVVWGGTEAVRSVIALPQQDHCETIAFGPKYSFAAFDYRSIASQEFDHLLAAAARDIVVFDQQACSSPHVLFFERGAASLGEIARRLGRQLEGLPARLVPAFADAAVAARVVNARAAHLLDDSCEVVMPDDLSWTILLNRREGLEEPVQGRCVFVKEVSRIEDVLQWVTRKVQAIGVAIGEEDRRRAFADRATAAGVDRIVPVGRMHDFDLPWDGVLALNRLVRWVILKS